jgi:probable HAF family extracellular repeat protein
MNVKLALCAIVTAVSTVIRATLGNCDGYSVEIFFGPDCSILPSFAHATGIAENGAICGGYVDCSEEFHPLIWWMNGDVTELPHSAEGGDPDTPFTVNSSGEVAGRMYLPGQSAPLNQAFIYSNGVTLDLGMLSGQDTAEAVAISADGIVVGTSNNTGFGPLTAFMWQDGVLSSLSLPYGTKSEAHDISDSGKICGWMGSNTLTDKHAFVHDLNSGSTIDVGVQLSGATASEGSGINNAGAICGESRIVCGQSCIMRRGFIWSDGEVQDLGVLPGKTNTRPQAINDSNVIVGFCDPGGTKAFVWRNGTMTALNDLIPPELNLDITLAWDINNAGQIVGQAELIGTTDDVAVRLTPIPSPIGDSDCDGDIDTDDLLGVINNWAHQSPKGSNPPALPPCDFDHDGTVELDDLMIVIDNWTA